VRRGLILLVLALGCAATRPPDVQGPGAEPTAMAIDSPVTPVAPPPVTTPAPVSSTPTPPRAVCTAFVRPGVISRAAIVRVVDAGLGQWLAGVEVEPAVLKGRFRGWTVRRLHTDDCTRQVDVLPGDLVLRVNGRSIERPEQASEVWASLKTASSLVVELVRGGKPRTITLPIE